MLYIKAPFYRRMGICWPLYLCFYMQIAPYQILPCLSNELFARNSIPGVLSYSASAKMPYLLYANRDSPPSQGGLFCQNQGLAACARVLYLRHPNLPSVRLLRD